VGLCLKIAVFPLHLWLPDAYAYAPAPVSALLAGTATKVAFYLLLRYFFAVHAPATNFAELPIDEVLLPLGVAGALVGALVAVFQDEPKRLLAWSSISQVGYLVVGASLATVDGVAASLAHVAGHALPKTALFLAMGAIIVKTGTVGRPLRFSDLHGLARRMPKTTAALVLAGLSLVGMPLSAGFVSKWLLIEALIAEEHWAAVVALVFSSLLAIVYVGRLLEPMFAPLPADPAAAPLLRLGRGATALLWTLCVATVVLGTWTAFNVDLAREAAGQLLLGGRR
jgi:multicomponent Na+:H+ antiporter subunit D